MEKETLSEGVCQGLTDAFRACSKSFTLFGEAMQSCNKQFAASAFHMSYANVLIFEAKVFSANFLTRWYWKRKLKKARKAFNQLTNFIQDENILSTSEG